MYNNFPWPGASAAQRARIEDAAQGILETRAQFPGASLADLYDAAAMPPALREAHRRNDRAVLAAYGWRRDPGEEEIVARLLELYAGLAAAEG